MNGTLTPRQVALGLIAVTLAVYATALQGDFHYDDFHSIVDNVSIRDPGLVPSFFTEAQHFSVDEDKAMYRPLLLATYALNYALHAEAVVGYHLVNLSLHLGCTLLLWRLILQLQGGGQPRVAALAAMLFAIHPIGSEPVNYVSSRSESLAALFVLLALWGALAMPKRPAVSVGGFCAGLLSKATAAAVPLLLLAWPDGGWSERVRRVWPYGVALLVYVAILGWGGLLPVSRVEPVRDLTTQFMTQVKAVPYYLHLLLMPVSQSVDPAFQEGTLSQGAMWLAFGFGLSLLGMVIFGTKGQRRWWLLWPLWLALPASAVPLNVLVNEHRIYLAVAGLFVSCADLLEPVLHRTRFSRLTVVALFLLAALTVQRNQVWASELTLWSDAVRRAPGSSRARVHLGNALREKGDLAAARLQFEQAVDIDPHLLPARTNLANLLYEEALSTAPPDVQLLLKAAEQYEAILKVESLHREALTNGGNALLALGDTARAQRFYERAISAHPDHPDAYDNLAQIRFDLRDGAGTQDLLLQVIRLEPENGNAWRRLGDARAALSGDLVGAAEAYRQACGLDPADAGSCYNLGEVLLALSQQSPPSPSRRYAQEAIRTFTDLRRRFGSYRRTEERLIQLRSQVTEMGQ